MRTRTKATAAALLLLAVLAAVLLAVRDLPVAGTGAPTQRPSGGAGPEGLSTGAPSHALTFTVTGSVTGLVPGGWRPVAVTVHNPNRVAIRVTSLALAVALESTPPGCSPTTNLEIEQPSWGRGTAITIAAGGSSTLAAQGVTDPRIRLRDLPDVNQDVCKGKSFSLVWSGTATS